MNYSKFSIDYSWGVHMCLACSIAEGNPNAKKEKQIDYQANQDYNSSIY